MKIFFTPNQPMLERLRDGMSVEATIDTDSAPPLNGASPAHILDHLAAK